jgi:hypothetical protein
VTAAAARPRRPRRALLFAGVLAAAALWPVPVLTVEAQTPARPLLRRIVWSALSLELRYTHSVEATPVKEVYRADRAGLHLVRMEFVSQGAGLPSSGYVREGGVFVLRPERSLLRELPLRVSARARPRLAVDSQLLDLLALAGDGGSVAIAVRGRPLRAALLIVLY